jgi:hypothetical protein
VYLLGLLTSYRSSVIKNKQINNYVRFQVLTAASVKIRVFWDVAPCSHIEVDRRFRALMMEAVRTYETSVNFNVTTRQYIPEDNSEHHTPRRENLKSHINIGVCSKCK